MVSEACSPVRKWQVINLWEVFKRLLMDKLHLNCSDTPHSSLFTFHQVECTIIICFTNVPFMCKMFSEQEGMSEWVCHFYTNYTVSLHFFLAQIKFIWNYGFKFTFGVLKLKELSPRIWQSSAYNWDLFLWIICKLIRKIKFSYSAGSQKNYFDCDPSM